MSDISPSFGWWESLIATPILGWPGALAGAAEGARREEAKAETRYAVCDFDPGKGDIRLFLNEAAGEPFGDLAPLAAARERQGETLAFAMNAGRYLKDRSPDALYLDGTIPRLYAPELSRNGPGARMGPIVGVVARE